MDSVVIFTPPGAHYQDNTTQVGLDRKLAGTKFDPRVVDALDAVISDGKIRLTAVMVEA